MKTLIVATPEGFIPDWKHCSCSSETCATICGTIIVCGGCDAEFNLSHYDVRFTTGDADREFEATING